MRKLKLDRRIRSEVLCQKRYSSNSLPIVGTTIETALPSYLTKQMVVLFDRKLGTQFKSIVDPKSEGIISGVAV